MCFCIPKRVAISLIGTSKGRKKKLEVNSKSHHPQEPFLFSIFGVVWVMFEERILYSVGMLVRNKVAQLLIRVCFFFFF